MSNKEVIFEYKGKVTFDTIDPLLDKLKVQSGFRNLKRGIQKRLYSVFVECIENIYKYEANDLDQVNNKKPYISLGKQDDQFVISTGNIIANQRIKGLQSRLERINRQDHAGLMTSYSKIIDQDIISSEEGAGLGLITIALISHNRINYTFTSVDQYRSYFEMNILIANRGKD
jgi:hypothetical protein